MEYTLDQQRILDERGPGRVSPHWIANMLPDTTTSHVATAIGARGVNYAIVGACATGTDAVGDAAEVIKRNQADVIIAGGTEAVLMPVVLAGFCAMRALAGGGDDPATASRPFDATRSGFVLAEGAAALVVEELEHALARGARIYCEVVGYGVSNDAYHVATPHPDSIGVIEMMRAALERSGIAPEEIDYINAHGTSTPYNDPAETQGDQDRLRRPRPQARGVVDQVDDGPQLRCRRSDRGSRDRAHDSPRRDPPDDQPEHTGSRMRPRLRATHGARGAGANRTLKLDGPRRTQRLHHPACLR